MFRHENLYYRVVGRVVEWANVKTAEFEKGHYLVGGTVQ